MDNAHETQWAVQDPTTDLAADQALFTATATAATLLGTDSSLVSRLHTALGQIRPYARTDQATHSQLLGPSADASGTDVIGNSYQPTAAIHNTENLGLEPVWPYGVIGDNTVVNGDNLTALAQRTYSHRQYVNNPDWTYDSIQAARLDLASEVANDLVNSTKTYQVYPSGLAAWNPGTLDEPYIEHVSNVAATLDEALATDYDGTLRFAPAWPAGWDVSGTRVHPGRLEGRRAGRGRNPGHRRDRGRHHADDDRAQPVGRPAGRGGRRLDRRRGGRPDHRLDAQRAGDRRPVVPGAAAVGADQRRCRSPRSPEPRPARAGSWATSRSA